LRPVLRRSWSGAWEGGLNGSSCCNLRHCCVERERERLLKGIEEGKEKMKVWRKKRRRQIGKRVDKTRRFSSFVSNGPTNQSTTLMRLKPFSCSKPKVYHCTSIDDTNCDVVFVLGFILFSVSFFFPQS